jgi:hypothetical protein
MALSLVGCASTAPVVSTPSAPVASTPVTTPVSTTAPAPATTAAQKKALMGYTKVVRNGKELYCRDDAATGSHMKTAPVCLTRQQVDDIAARGEAFARGLQDRPIPTTPSNPMGQ